MLQRLKATSSRETKGNWFSDDCVTGYDGAAAHRQATDRCARHRELIGQPQLRNQVVERIKSGRLPEQICNRLIREGATLRICQETIYWYIDSKEGRTQELWWYPPEHHRARRVPKADRVSRSMSEGDAGSKHGATCD
ncbi:transposase [Thioclava dalianensis]|uniref:Transposase n=1 Tax=Thioclava dalianensis TaxID=1185766 RepID=A0A074U0F1_9RHOB|nr:hypothetical protein [Thioclava dalianensis]KEP68162.1 transposase [Thioclava dalianensis]SFN85705.1 hypothetical protein SAMN05216224_1183 [Thioclava dalianensis]